MVASWGAFGQSLDTIIFGDAASESAHSLSNYFTITVTNSGVTPAQTARRCTVVSASNIYGGNLTFNMAVDPNRRTYFSARFWGGDEGTGSFSQASDMGRLYLYVPISQFTPGNTNNYQIGYRHEGDYICLNVTGGRSPLPGRFFYSTTLLPLWMTQGRTNLTFKIVSTGRIYPLGSSGTPATGNNYQFFMVTNSRSIYRAYTHTDPVLMPTGEVQGTKPTITTRPTPTETVLNPAGAFYNGVNGYISGRMSTAATNLDSGAIEFLARSYFVSNLPTYYNSAAVITKVVAGLDAQATAHYADANYAGNGWGGALGASGWAIAILSGLPQFQTNLDVTESYGVGGSKTRRAAWGDMLLASRDAGRFDRRGLSNQSLIADENIYKANRGLLALTNVNAFTEIDAQRYLLEAIGLRPYRGSDLAGGGSEYPFGTNYFQVTPKGLTREWGYVGVSYGELQWYAANFYRYTTNSEFLDQCVKMANARAPFRRPSSEPSGANNYRSMEGIGLLAWRGAIESDGDYCDEMAYADRAGWSLGMRCAAVTLNSNLVGFAKQMLADNQYFNALTYASVHYSDRGALDAWQDYNTIKNLPDPGIRLPMTDGRPDFVWADEVSGIVAIKRGGERLWVAPYWQAKAGTGVNGVGRFHFSTTNYDHFGVLETTPQFDFSGSFYVRPNLMDKPENNHYVPPDNPANAYAGERLPLATIPAGVLDDGPFRGKCTFYAFRYGNYLVGMNATSNRNFELKLPTGVSTATNVATGLAISAPVMVALNSTVVLYLDSPTNACPSPSTPLSVNAVGNNTPAVALDWNAASGATGYNVKRSSVSGGPYVTIANVAGTNYTDTAVTKGQIYYYVVSGTNSCGESSYDSVEFSASAGLPSPWLNTDIGTVGVKGGANFQGGDLIVRGAGSDIGSTSDHLHFVYLPLVGNGTITARLASQQTGGTIDKVGVMMRETTNSNSRIAAALLDLQLDKPRFPTRSSVGGNMSWQDAATTLNAPVWLRVTRTGNSFTGLFSTNGVYWTQIGSSVTVSMASSYVAGLAVCARTTAALDVSTFDNVSITGQWPYAPATPTNFTAMAGDAVVHLVWSPSIVTENYYVKRAASSGGSYTTIATNLTTSFADSSVTNGSLYYYKVAAVNSVGPSADSVVVSAQPVSLAPVSLTQALVGNQLEIFWPATHRGWFLEAQTNVLGIGISTNWALIGASAASNFYALPLHGGNGSVFLRLVPPVP